MTKTQGTKPPSRVARLKARIAKWDGRIARGDALQQRRKAKLATLKKRLGALLALSLSVQASSPPLSPAEAVAVLRASKSDRDRSNVYVPSSTPRVVVVTRPVERPRVDRVRSIAEVPWAERQAVPWKHTAPAAEDPTIRNVRIVR